VKDILEMILRFRETLLDILNDLEELRLRWLQNLILPPGLGCEISDDVLLELMFGWGVTRLVKCSPGRSGKRHPH